MQDIEEQLASLDATFEEEQYDFEEETDETLRLKDNYIFNMISGQVSPEIPRVDSV